MKYALMIHIDPTSFPELSEDEARDVSRQYREIRELDGVFGGAELQSPDASTTVRVNEGKTLTIDGPFADTKEFLGGFYLLEADDLDHALEVAARIPATRMGGAVEVRPIVEQTS